MTKDPSKIEWDFAVVGAGPAGCAAAIELARSGARVALFDKATFPRDKLCGEFLSPEVARILEGLGCSARFRAARPAPIDHSVVVTPSGARLEFPLPLPAWGLSRKRFDHLLVKAAQAAGARLIEKTEIARVGATLEARDGRRFHARRALLSAGRHSLLQPAPRAARGFFGFKAHYKGECAGRVELYFFRGGYCGLAPVEGGRVNFCALVEKKLLGSRSAEQLLSGVPALRERMAGLQRVEPFLYTGPVAMGWKRAPPGLWPAGDAALMIDPFTGDGVSLALQTGQMAARRALTSAADDPGHLARFAEELRRRFAPQLGAARLLRTVASTPWLERSLLALLAGDRFRRAALDGFFRATRDFSALAATPAHRRQ